MKHILIDTFGEDMLLRIGIIKTTEEQMLIGRLVVVFNNLRDYEESYFKDSRLGYFEASLSNKYCLLVAYAETMPLVKEELEKTIVSADISKKYDDKGNATHYSDNRINTIWQLERIWGSQAVVLFCEMNAFKYRSRVGKKDDPQLEITKIDWYEKTAKQFLTRSVLGLDGFTIDLHNHDFKID